MPDSSFSADFDQARARFKECASGVGAELDSYRHPQSGPADEEVSTDVAWIGPADASKVFVMVSGTHGVEGFCGSGAQVEWLRRATAPLPPDMAVLLIHAINPYGFAWSRRVTHENIDLNRNWADYRAPLPDNAEYGALAEALCPSEWTTQSRGNSQAILLAYVRDHGIAAFVQAVSSGQYQHPQGLFFGGLAPSWSRETLTSILQQRLSHAARVAIVDFHSGLGAAGFGELIAGAPDGSAAFHRARTWYGAAVKGIGKQGESFAKIAGDWISATQDLLPRAEVTPIAIEFGTVDAMQVLDALRADNWLHAHGDPRGPEAHDIRKQMRAAFYTEDDVWRGMILGQSLAACRSAMAGLQTA